MGWRSEALAEAVSSVEASLELAWHDALAEAGVAAGTADETAFAWLIAEDPSRHPWRVADAALTRLACPQCARPLGGGPRECDRCAYFDGLRFAAREIDRPGVAPGNEHALRVASAVARTRGRYSPRARAGYELLLPALLAGELPTTPQAQAAKALINRLTPDECDTVTSLDEVARLALGR